MVEVVADRRAQISWKVKFIESGRCSIQVRRQHILQGHKRVAVGRCAVAPTHDVALADTTADIDTYVDTCTALFGVEDLRS